MQPRSGHATEVGASPGQTKGRVADPFAEGPSCPRGARAFLCSCVIHLDRRALILL